MIQPNKSMITDKKKTCTDTMSRAQKKKQTKTTQTKAKKQQCDGCVGGEIIDA